MINIKFEKVKISKENVLDLIKSEKIYIQTINKETSPIGDADFEILSHASGFNAKLAKLEDAEFLLNNPTKSIRVMLPEVAV